MRRRRKTLARDLLPLAVFGMLAIGSRARPGRPARRPSGGSVLTLDQLRELARSVGFPEGSVDIAAAVAKAESDGIPTAVNVVTNPKPGFLPERSYGLWQINVLAHPSFDASRLLEPEYNARAALVVSSGGLDWHHWSTFTAPPSSPRSYTHWMPGGSNA